MAIVTRITNKDQTEVLHSWSPSRQQKRYIYDSQKSYIDTEYPLRVMLQAHLLKMPYYRVVGFRADGSYYDLWGNGFPAASTASIVYDYTKLEMEERVAEIIYSKARQESSFNLGIALAEARQTAGLISSTALRLGSAFRNLRKGRINDAFSVLKVSSRTKVPYTLRGFGRSQRVTAGMHKKSLKRRALLAKDHNKFAAEAWLEMRYGWTPLMYDVYGSAEYLAKLFADTDVDLTLDGVFETSGKVMPASANHDTSGSAKWIYRMDLDFKISNPALRNLSSLGLTNPALVAWELVPFSFVADWFLPVGDWMQNFTALQGLEFVQGSKTSFKTDNWSINITYGSSYVQGSKPSGAIAITERSYSGIPSIPLPRFSLFERIGAKRAIDAVALLRTAFK